jgi:hypothetical protein
MLRAKFQGCSPMRTTRRFFALSLAAAGAGAALAPQDAAACQCLEENWADVVAGASFFRTEVIFRGRVVSIVPLLEAEPRHLRGMSTDEARDVRLLQFEVYDRVKGDVGERIEVMEFGHLQFCGYGMSMGAIVLVRATRDPALGLTTGPCIVYPDADGSHARYLRTLM